jgi:NAD(P)-dependent dehydrogenase (short-subunit alcohol dehydrogenase family)
MACVSVEVSPHWQQLPKSTYKTFGINVKGFLFTVQKALPLFQDGGSIILAASAGASKGLEALSFPPRLSRTVDLKHCKIRVNGISPGPIDTPIIFGSIYYKIIALVERPILKDIWYCQFNSPAS